MTDIFDWTGAPGARFDDPASWYDATLDAPATQAPGPDDIAVFGPGDWTATAGGQVGTLLIEEGASVTLAGTGAERFLAGSLTEATGSSLQLEDALLFVNAGLTIGRDAVLDIGGAASFEAFPGSPLGPFSVAAGTLALLGPGDGAGGGSVVLGANNIEIGLFQNGNSGIGNEFAPASGFSGSGQVIAGTFDQPNVRIFDPDHMRASAPADLAGLDFGTLHVGDPAVVHFSLINLSGNGGYSAKGAVQTLVNGGNVTDPALAGSGVTPQNFGIAPRGGIVAFEVTLDTTAALLLQDQAVHLGYEFMRFQFDVGTTLPITGAVLNYADPGFELVSGPGALAQDGAHWTLDLGSLAQGSDPGTVVLAVRNLAAAPADDLSGRFEVAGDAAAVEGAEPFAGLAAGDGLVALGFRLDTTVAGPHAETITLYPVGSNASGFEGALPVVTLTVTDQVVAEGRPEHGGHHRGHGHGHADRPHGHHAAGCAAWNGAPAGVRRPEA
ncbi:hypothetical protein ACFQS7_02485 [Dankookia sp. GCM10030260]|uniref:hypothetical protein n=1 Tax=Dankookia sp. GCM10030260 TaxID=3273390 RepID=UPI0036228E35